MWDFSSPGEPEGLKSLARRILGFGCRSDQASAKLRGMTVDFGNLAAVPLVLAMNDASESGISYDDHPYVSYEYPTAYRNQIQPGESFVYYRGRRKALSGRQPQVYLGTGIVGSVRPSKREGRLVCEILDGEPFEDPVFFKDEEAQPLEPGGLRRGYYQRGVRRIEEGTFAEIVRRGRNESQTYRVEVRSPPKGSLYASPATGRALERYSRRVAIDLLTQRHEGIRIEEMPTNYPGFDLLTDLVEHRHIEVKATQAPFPRFMLSEGERRFATEHAGEYSLVVVYGIDLQNESHAGEVWASDDLENVAGLRVVQWAGQLDESRVPAESR